ncbi:hypothetical protein [Brevibacillus sp. DP1.3A]|uniref:hypothetical protein n=1 Tax=Brevibacillus sp. DP1.3A TaxID=2738867 RepID=UPI00156A7886|nr:hypothetical protein [Brevibacillus sp. DP1.3A]MED1913880.1 hypothetical protein [Bacillus thuringiensis]UED76301.1 HD domain-containing protein [Brevibacillus sp. DP1.3A]
MQMVTTTMVNSQKLWMVVKRMEPHLIRNQANMEKLLKMLMIHDVASVSGSSFRGLRIDDVSNGDIKELWSEFESNETYEAKVAHAIIRLIDQIEIEI